MRNFWIQVGDKRKRRCDTQGVDKGREEWQETVLLGELDRIIKELVDGEEE